MKALEIQNLTIPILWPLRLALEYRIPCDLPPMTDRGAVYHMMGIFGVWGYACNMLRL